MPDATPIAAPPERRWYQHRLRMALIVVTLLAIAYFGARTLLYPAFDQNPGPFNREHFEAIVAEVRALGLKPGESVQLRMDDVSVPKSIRSLKPSERFPCGHGAGTVWATVTVDGKLKVVIETKDLGHAGEYGFGYSEAPLLSTPLEGTGAGDWLQLDLPGLLNLVLPKMKIDDQWWEVCYNLD